MLVILKTLKGEKMGELKAKHRYICAGLKGLSKNGTGQFKNPFASLKDINEKLIPLMEKEGVTLHHTFSDDGLNFLTFFQDCDSGDDIEISIPTIDVKSFNPRNLGHAIGSMITYYRRYSLNILFNISDVAEDDGGAMQMIDEERELEEKDPRDKDQKQYDHNHVFHFVTKYRNKTLVDLDVADVTKYLEGRRKSIAKGTTPNPSGSKLREMKLLTMYSQDQESFHLDAEKAVEALVEKSDLNKIKTVKDSTFTIGD